MVLVSIVMPVLNAGPWLAEAVDSILGQTHTELELIIVDDGSSDDSRDIAAAAATRDPRVRTTWLEPAPHLTSSSRATNVGNALAKGAYIGRMDADDVSLPHRIEAQLAFLHLHGVDACGGNAQGFGDSHTLFVYPTSNEAIHRELIFRVGTLHPTLLARAELIRTHPFLESASWEDYEWQVRISRAGARLGNVPDVLLRRRIHPRQANVRHGALFQRDLRRYRFHHVLRLFPNISPADYQILAGLAERAAIESRQALLCAGAWLERLTCRDDAEHCRIMARRWKQACDRAGLTEDDALRRRFEGAFGLQPA